MSEKKKRIFESDEVTMWTVEGTSKEDALKDISPVCVIDEDNLLYLYVAGQAHSKLFPVEVFKLFVMRKVSTKEFHAKFVIQHHIPDDSPRGAPPLKEVRSVGCGDDPDPKASALSLFEELKSEGIVVGRITVKDLSKCNSMEDMMKAWGAPRSVFPKKRGKKK